MKEFFSKVRSILFKYYNTVVSSIAFYPTIISFVFFILSLTMLSVETREVTKWIDDNMPALLISDPDTARTILGTIVGGIISLTVFSFSMVMVMLNQTSTSYSPRLLPGLISDKKNQFVLGTYLGTIIYNIVVLISVLPNDDKYTIKGFSIFLGIAFGIFSLGLFIFFIHSISTNIQISNILEYKYKETKKRLDYLIDINRQLKDSLNLEGEVITVRSDKSGYLKEVNIDGLKKAADNFECEIKVLPYKGKYIQPNEAVVSCQCKEEKSDTLIENIKNCLIYDNKRSTENDYVHGIKQITEVGVKAMSPGINDPGTTLVTIDFLSELFALRMKLPNDEIYCSVEGFKVEINTVDFDRLIGDSLAAYRQYCKHDVILMSRLIDMLHYLKEQTSKREDYISSIEKEIKALHSDIISHIKNEYDRSFLENKIETSSLNI